VWITTLLALYEGTVKDVTGVLITGLFSDKIEIIGWIFWRTTGQASRDWCLVFTPAFLAFAAKWLIG
jgi:hypothetical protein